MLKQNVSSYRGRALQPHDLYDKRGFSCLMYQVFL